MKVWPVLFAIALLFAAVVAHATQGIVNPHVGVIGDNQGVSGMSLVVSGGGGGGSCTNGNLWTVYSDACNLMSQMVGN